MDKTEQLLKELTETNGAPGHEGRVRSVMRNWMQPLGELSQDKTGNLVCCLPGKSARPRIMLAAHMDEVSFMVRYITETGFIKFYPMGNWVDQALLGQRVVIQTSQGDRVGVIGSRPHHLTPPEERSKGISMKDMYIDIGASSRKEVEDIGVQVGDPVVPRADFVPLANGKTYLSKAFDDRVGLALIIRTLQTLQGTDHPNTILGTATVQEEVGARGATTAVRLADPDFAIVLEGGISGDVPGVKPEEMPTRLGGGPMTAVIDRLMITNTRLRDFMVNTAREANVPLQLIAIEGGATDGSVIHLHNLGVPTICLAVPARHIHTHSAIVHRDDLDLTARLIAALIMKLDQAAVEKITE